MYKFSVLMANYNNGKYIKEAIKSVLNQTYGNWELIIVDDASTDNSVDVIKPFLADKRIRFFQNNKNLGCGATKRKCAEMAVGGIMGELDSDDALDPRTLEIMVAEHARSRDCGFIYSSYYLCDENLEIKNKADWIGDVGKYKTNLRKLKAAPFRTFKTESYRKTAGYNPRLKSAVDLDLIYKLEEVTKTKFVDEFLYYYRLLPQSVSSVGINGYKAEINNIFSKYAAYQRRLNTKIPNLTKREVSSLFLHGALMSFKLNDFNRAPSFVLLSLKIFPFNLRGYLFFLLRIFKFIPYRLLLFIRTGSFKIKRRFDIK